MNTNQSALIVPPDAATSNLATNDIRAIQPPMDLPSEWAWIWWVLAFLVLAAMVAGLILFLVTRKAKPPPVPKPIPPHARARMALGEALGLIHDPKPFCIRVSDILRLYLEEQFDFHAPDRTTEEFLLELQASPVLSPDQKDSLSAFLESCDLVKFARFEPTEDALRELHNAAGRLVDETSYQSVQAPGARNVPPPPVSQS